MWQMKSLCRNEVRKGLRETGSAHIEGGDVWGGPETPAQDTDCQGKFSHTQHCVNSATTCNGNDSFWCWLWPSVPQPRGMGNTVQWDSQRTSEQMREMVKGLSFFHLQPIKFAIMFEMHVSTNFVFVPIFFLLTCLTMTFWGNYFPGSAVCWSTSSYCR